MKLPIYLDYSATTPVDPRVAEKMIPYLCEHFGNPASRSHSFGWVADAAVEEAREQVADLVNADPKEIIWTSGATESNNLAIKGAANFYAGTKGKHIITVKTEHKAVLDTVRELERQGFEATYLDVKDDGLLDLEVFKAAIRPDTVLASVMFVNNEVGVIQPIAELGEICREKGIIFHVDAAQATGKVDIDLSKLSVASRVFALRHRCTVVAMNVVSVPGPCRRIRSSGWVNASVWPKKKWPRKTSASARCATSC